MSEIGFLQAKATQNRIDVLKTIMSTKKGHIGGTYSCIDILTVLYYCIMNYDIKNPDSINRDRLIIGKGHACLGVYNILIDLGFIDRKLLRSYGSDNSYLGAQLDIKIPGVEINTGSLGHAIGIVAGLALASKLDGINFKSYALVGDGECDEGSIWESAMFIGQNQIKNLYIIVDRNRQSVTDYISEEDEVAPLEQKFEGCGIKSVTVNGHSFEELIDALSKDYEGPVAIICDTVKGKGVSYMESGIKWHHSIPKEEQYQLALKELEESLTNG